MTIGSVSNCPEHLLIISWRWLITTSQIKPLLTQVLAKVFKLIDIWPFMDTI